MGWRRPFGLAIIGLALALLALPAHADDWEKCGGANLDASITACSSIIDAGTDKAKNISMAYTNRGNAYYGQGLFDSAIEDYDRAIAVDPKYANAYVSRGMAYDAKGETGRAIQDYDRAIAAIALDPKQNHAHHNRGYSYLRKGDSDRAFKEFDQAIAIDPKNTDAYVFRAYIHEQRSEPEKAKADYRKALALRPGDKYATDALARLMAAKTEPDASPSAKASTSYADSSRDCSKSPDIQRRFDGCSAVIDAGTDSAKNISLAYYNRGATYYVKKDYDRAIADYDRAAELNPDSVAVYIFRADAYRSKGDHDRAIEDYGRAIAFWPHDADLYYKRGNSHYHKGDYGGAIKDYDRAIAHYNSATALDVTKASLFNSRCWARAVAGTGLDLARADCDAALALSANDPATLDSRGLVGIKQKLFDKAWTDYDAAHRAAPEFAGFLYGRGIAALRLGRTAEGNADLAAAMKLNGRIAEAYARYGVPKPASLTASEPAKASSSYADHRKDCMGFNLQRRIDGCSAIIGAGTEPAQKMARTYYNRGSAYEEMSDYDRAIKDLDQAITLDPKMVIAYYVRGVIHERRGNKKKAIAEFRKVLSLQPGNRDAAKWLERLAR